MLKKQRENDKFKIKTDLWRLQKFQRIDLLEKNVLFKIEKQRENGKLILDDSKKARR